MFTKFSVELDLTTDDSGDLDLSDVAQILRSIANDLDDDYLAGHVGNLSGNVAGYYEFS